MNLIDQKQRARVSEGTVFSRKGRKYILSFRNIKYKQNIGISSSLFRISSVLPIRYSSLRHS